MSPGTGPASQSAPPGGGAAGPDVNGPTAEGMPAAATRGRALHLFGSPSVGTLSIHLRHDRVDLCFGGSYRPCTRVANNNDDQHDTDKDDEDPNVAAQPDPKQHDCCYRSSRVSGYASLMAFVEHLQEEQEFNHWKVTLAQERIGQGIDDACMPRTASYFLARGMLRGPLLHHLIDSEIRVIRNLQLLTMPEEVDVVDHVRAEYERIMACQRSGSPKFPASKVSKLVDEFAGRSIRKNYDPIRGRFVLFKQFCMDLQCNVIHLKPKEVLPARHLETLFGDFRVSFEETFHLHPDDRSDNDDDATNTHHNRPIFDCSLDQWQSLLELSLSMKHPNATNRVWTSGLTDGRLQNMYLSESDLVFFDLGAPTLEPIPAVLTKFLMSFFHT
jgi:hypothetical protein